MDFNKKHRWSIAIAYTLFIFYASLTNIKVNLASAIEHKDKIVHIAMYCTYTIIWFAYFNYHEKKIKYANTILLVFSTGVLIEILQETLTSKRSGDLYDVVANSIGIIIAVLLLKQPKIINALKLKK